VILRTAVIVIGLGLVLLLCAMVWQIRRRQMHWWLGSYLKDSRRRRAAASRLDGETHLLLCVADHYEPKHGGAPPEQAMARVQRWVTEYPRLFERFRDADGRPPQHTFFYPIDEYDDAEMAAIAGLCRKGFGEVEVHLHHDNDTSQNLRRTLLEYKTRLAERFGLLSRDRVSGEIVYGFVHGNWSLDNSRPDGRWCGVNDELNILRETGCYCDFTMPSAPSDTQTRMINSIYYAVDDPRRPKSHDHGLRAGSAPAPANALMLIQGPLVLDWGRRKGLMPKVENGCIQYNQPLDIRRLGAWMKAGIQVETRPDWFFVKLYGHGAPERNADRFLGEATVRFHEALQERAKRDPRFHYHYITAREMYNLAAAAESGWSGSIAEARDSRVVPLQRSGALAQPSAHR
jgi:hypothetical protein